MPSISKTFASAVMALAMAPFSQATPAHLPSRRSHCPPVVGTFNMTVYQLYQEGLDFDSIHCKIYAGSVYNQSMVSYDPYTNEHKTILFPGISGNSTYHVSGIDFDPLTGAIYAMANAAAPFTGQFGYNLVGPNFLIKYDTFSESIVYISDFADVTAKLSKLAGQSVNGYQDQAEDTHGNSYVVMTFGSAIVKVNPKGKASVFYHTPAAEIGSPPGLGYGGLVSLGDTLIVPNSYKGKFVSFDTQAAVPAETLIPITKQPANITIQCDGVLLPSRYCDKVILCSQDEMESIFVYGSKDGWKSGEYIGAVKNDSPLAAQGLSTATVQVADNVFISNMFFQSADRAGDRSEFPLIDITAQVDKLVSAAGI